MFRVIAPLKRNAPSKKYSFLSSYIIDLEFVYPNLLFKASYDYYWNFLLAHNWSLVSLPIILTILAVPRPASIGFSVFLSLG